MGCTKFGERWDAGHEELIVEAFIEAIADAGIEPKDIQAAWLGTQYTEVNQGVSGLPLAETLKLPFIPVTHVENMCASGSESLRGACYAVASGAVDIALAVGVEKLKDVGYGGLPDMSLGARGKKDRLILPNFTAPGNFAMMGTRYFSRYGLSPEEGKMMLAKISSKSHHNGAMCEKAHLRREAPVDVIMKAPIVAWPLGLYDCCGVSDGSAAAIVVRADMAKKFRADPVYVKALQIAASSGEEQMYTDYDYTHVETTTRAAVRAYAEAGIKNPRQEISMAEVHDCFSITEAVTMEDLQFSPRGRVKEDIDAGRFDLTGEQPIQTDGGLKCFGHPIGASGLRMMYEEYKQLQGKCGPRQVKNPKFGMTHNLGGFPPRCVVSLFIVGNELG
ncbi:MAG: acetyl-CoA acetyltransferase [Chloroflexi bacterium]|nr:acetyl-CoA acetyltransferase [Chloroflexota bacterium]